jgi:secondary thiamine-phosphate synthase enzyme
MKVYQELLEVRTAGRGLVDVTEAVQHVVGAAGVKTGLCTVFCRHTSASLVIQENADPSVRRDLQRWMDRVAPEGPGYEHTAEGPDDMPSHLRTVLTRTSEQIPIARARLALGTWQALYLWEHRTSPHVRELVVHIAGA